MLETFFGVITDKINNSDTNQIIIKSIGMATFTKFLDKHDEPLISIESVSNIKNDKYIVYN